jgi:hypothetical protein
MSVSTHFTNSFTYVFKDEQWLSKTWPLFVITLVPVFGLLGLIFFKGWRFQVVQHASKGHTNLPDLDLLEAFRKGLILWVFTFVYLLVPSVICMLLGIGGLFAIFADIYEILIEGFEYWIKDEPTDIVYSLLVYAVWFVIMRPMYQVGLIKYAITCQWIAMLNIPYNLLSLLRHLHWFIMFFVFWVLMLFIIVAIDTLLVFTVVGAFLIPSITICLYYITSSYELSLLAQRMNKKYIKNKDA